LFTSAIRLSTLLGVTETGGEVGVVRVLPGVPPELVRTLVDGLVALDAGFAAFSARLEAGTVHEHAFGKLIDAAKVRDAYHDRLPATRVNLTEAAEVARSFIAEFAAQDTPSVPDAPSLPDTPSVPDAPSEQAEPEPSVPPQREARE
jgi:hypothetical protein